MAMIDVSAALTSPYLANDFIVQRDTGSFVEGGYTGKSSKLRMSGPVYPSTNKELRMLPEADRPSEAMTFNSMKEILTTNKNGRSDIVIWNNEQYRVLAVFRGVNFHFWTAIAVRMAGN